MQCNASLPDQRSSNFDAVLENRPSPECTSVLCSPLTSTFCNKILIITNPSCRSLQLPPQKQLIRRASTAARFDHHFLFATSNSNSNTRVRAMASQEAFPPQHQDTQPGKEHVMEPNPRAGSHDYKPANKLQGKVAIVTGGDSGIGRAVCYCFAQEGAMVAFTYVKSQEEKDATDTLSVLWDTAKQRNAKEPMAIPADLGFEENCQKVVDEVVNAYGGQIDILVNNAAEQYMQTSIQEISEEQLERVFRTNIFSYFFMTKYVMKHMKEGGSIINTTSINAYRGNATLLDYTSTKGAIVAFTRGLALQLVQKGIRVNGVAPGPVWTPLIPASMPEEKVKNFGKEVPMQRAAQPSEIAPSYVFLASNIDSSYISGQVLHPNGGVIING